MTRAATLTPRQRRRVLAAGIVAVVVASLAAIVVGTDGVSLAVLVDPDDRALLLPLRARRVVIGLLVGGALAATGAALQAMLRNPLADPYVIGVSGGAAIGGALAVGLGGVLADAGLPIATSAGALVASAGLAWFVARDRSGRSETAILVGVVFNAFAWALVAVVKTTLPAARTQALLFWLIGAIGYPSPTLVVAAAILVVGGVALLTRAAGPLALLALGEDEARRLGVDSARTKLVVYAASSLLVGVAVATTGIIGFVGLIVPHALRLRGSADERVLIPASALFGAAALAAFDAASRGSFAAFDTELPVGALTAVVGAPLFALALWRRATSPGGS